MERIFDLYYKFRLAQKGVKLCGKRGKLIYGVDTEGKWYFYYVYDFTVIFVKKCEDKLKALFIYNILLNKDA